MNSEECVNLAAMKVSKILRLRIFLALIGTVKCHIVERFPS